MIKRTCDVCSCELVVTQPKFVIDPETKERKIKTIKKYNPLSNKMEEITTFETEEVLTNPVVVQLNLNNHDMIYREYCLGCYKKIHSEVEKFWNILYGSNNL